MSDQTPKTLPPTGIKNRGFGSMTPERRREVSRKGSDAAKKRGLGHRWTPAQARDAAAKGLVTRQQHKAEKEAARLAAQSVPVDHEIASFESEGGLVRDEE